MIILIMPIWNRSKKKKNLIKVNIHFLSLGIKDLFF